MRRSRLVDAAGRRVRALFDGFAERGEHQLVWDGADEVGRAAASGIYFVRLEGEEGVTPARRIVRLR